MRVTDGMRDAALLATTTRSASAVFTAAGAAATGIRVASASDDPAAYARIVRIDEQQRRLSTRIETLDRGAGEAAAAESALAQSSELLRQVKEIAVAMADGTAGPEERAAAAASVAELRRALVGLANAKGASGHLFAGSRADAPAFDPTGTFLGDDVALGVETDDGVRIRSNASGAAAFTASGGRDVFSDLAALESMLAANDPAGVAALFGPLDEGYGQVVRERSRIGLTVERMRTSSNAADLARMSSRERRAGDAEIDATEAYTQLVQAQSAHERTLEVSKKLLSTLSVERMLP